MQKVMEVAEKVIDNAVDVVKEIPNKTDRGISVKDIPEVQPERKKIPFPINPHWKSDMQKTTDHQAVASTEKESIIKKINAEQNPVPAETVQTAERPLQPQPSMLARKYPRLKESENKLKEQNKAIFGREQKSDKLKKELSECTGIFKGGRRKELQQEIDSIDAQLSNMKKWLSSIVKEYNFDSVQAFYKELNAAKKENQDYEMACAGYEKTYENEKKNRREM